MGTPQHGAERNRRSETSVGPAREWTIFSTGEKVQIPGDVVTYPVSERWCDKCGTWITARGIISIIVAKHECPTCGTPWEQK